jgi:hypothetical protein
VGRSSLLGLLSAGWARSDSERCCECRKNTQIPSIHSFVLLQQLGLLTHPPSMRTAHGAGRLDATQRLSAGPRHPNRRSRRHNPSSVIFSLILTASGRGPLPYAHLRVIPDTVFGRHPYRVVPFALFGQKVRRNKVRRPRQRVSLVSGFFIDSSSLINAEKEKLRGFVVILHVKALHRA